MQVLGEAAELPSDLRAIVEAAGPDDYIEGSVLVALCTQRSGQRGNGCDAPEASEEFPAPMASPPRPPTPPAVQVRQYSWHHYAKKKGDLCDIRREFVGANRQTNRTTHSLSQQKPLVARSHLMAVVRRVERGERLKGKLQKESMFKGLHKSQGKHITSLLSSRQKPEGISQQYSVIRDDAEHSNSEMDQIVHASKYANDRYTLKSSKNRKGKEEVKFKPPGSTNDDDIECDVIEYDNDAIIRDTDVNKLIARKRYVPKKHSFVHIKEFLKSTLSMCSRTFTFIALILAIVISVVGGLFNIRLPERKSTIGTSSEPLIRFRASSVLSILRESAAAIIHISEGLCSCMYKRTSLHNNKQLIRHMKILQNTIICEETFCTQNLVRSSELAKPLITTRSLGYSILSYVTLTQNVLAGKRFDTYIFPPADFCAFRVYYLDTYTVNFELDDNFKVFFDHVYLYILTFYHSWSSCHWATYASDIFYTLVYFSLNWIVSVIRSHDKYQSLILIRLALTRKANSGNQYILCHFRSYWTGWRPLVTPWACCIKEGTEPRISQKRFYPSHA